MVTHWGSTTNSPLSQVGIHPDKTINVVRMQNLNKQRAHWGLLHNAAPLGCNDDIPLSHIILKSSPANHFLPYPSNQRTVGNFSKFNFNSKANIYPYIYTYVHVYICTCIHTCLHTMRTHCFEPMSSQTNDLKTDTWHFLARHLALLFMIGQGLVSSMSG